MLNTSVILLIFMIILASAYYASHYVVNLRHNRNVIADELKRATDHIEELEARVMMLEAERDTELNRMNKYHNPPEGYGVFGIRG